MAFGLGNLVQGLMGNFSEQSPEKLQADYQDYLMADETVQSGYTLIRDAIIFTNRRLLFIDRQGATGKKTALKSIYLMNIVDVDVETAGMGIDDSQLTITYLKNVKLFSHHEESATLLLEFPKSADVLALYRFLLELAYENRLRINQKHH
ncbi:PH domain-containing protein [Aerococcaceae bacterium NML201209]|nr:PH domain-containing protein [Aerococcaceae bacterium NML201209]